MFRFLFGRREKRNDVKVKTIRCEYDDDDFDDDEDLLLLDELDDEYEEEMEIYIIEGDDDGF